MTVWNLGDHIAFQRPDVAARTNLARLLARTSSCDFGDSINRSQCNKLILGRQAVVDHNDEVGLAGSENSGFDEPRVLIEYAHREQPQHASGQRDGNAMVSSFDGTCTRLKRT